jgi:hypothetical protein
MAAVERSPGARELEIAPIVVDQLFGAKRDGEAVQGAAGGISAISRDGPGPRCRRHLAYRTPNVEKDTAYRDDA